MAIKHRLSDKSRAEIRALRQQGHTNKALAIQFGVSEQTIIRICRPDLYEKNLESNKRYQNKNSKQIYQACKANSKTYKLELHKINDADIINYLDSRDNVQGYLRSMIVNDIEKKY